MAWDTYDWYLELGPLSNVNATYFHGRVPTWNAFVAHPTYPLAFRLFAKYFRFLRFRAALKEPSCS